MRPNGKPVLHPSLAGFAATTLPAAANRTSPDKQEVMRDLNVTPSS